jgi:selenocysteine lyase/cysteine desulfurase
MADLVWDVVPPPAPGAAAMQIGFPDPVASARLAAALEELAAVGPAVVAARVAEQVARVLELADEAGLDVVSPRAESDRAGIVVVDPRPDRLTALTAALLNAGVSVTVRQGRVRIAPHAGTTDETLLLLRSALREAAATTKAVR